MNDKLTQWTRTVDDKFKTRYSHWFTASDVTLGGFPSMGVSRSKDSFHPHPSLHSRPAQRHQLISTREMLIFNNHIKVNELKWEKLSELGLELSAHW